MRAPTLLVVDDDPSALEYAALLFREKGHETRTATNGVEAVLAIEAQIPDVVVSDLRMPEMDGFELLAHVKSRWPGLPVILVTVVDDVACAVEAIQRGAVNCLIKPATPSALLSAVTKCFSAVRPEPSATGHIPEILGCTRAMVDVRRLVAIAASCDVNVLIVGETGTGKELVARAIHWHSSTRDRPFIAHNCAATPKELFENQFFGHRRGAFTGATHDHVGLIEQADGGTLLLDELQALTAENQAKCLRVVDDGEVRPVGSSRVRTVSVRYLASTNRDPEKLIADRLLREDLYYRLCGIEIRLPPLRDRRADIPILAKHLLGSADGSFTADALDALCGSRWPGNVRQLRNVVRSAKALAGAGKVALRHLSLEPGPGRRESEGPAELARRDSLPAHRLRDLEGRAIKEVLDRLRGNLSHAARELGIDRSTLRRKIRALGIEGGRRN